MFESHTQENNQVECPRCGKHTVVHPQANVYRCINCNFKRDIGRDRNVQRKKDDELSFVLAAVITLLLIIAIV